METPLHLVAPQPSFPGLYRAAVSDNDDSTHRGRIRVTVPAVYELSTPDAAVWAVPCQPWGHFFVPEVGDKVWVAFEDGDPAYPVWLGQWYPSGGAPQDAAVSPPAKRLIVSKAGHELLFDDSDGAEKLVIHSKNTSQSIVLDDAPGGEKVTITDKTGSSIELSSSGITIHAPGLPIVLKGASVDVQSG